MALRKILTLEHPALRRKAKKVSRFDAYLERLVNDMFETMRDAPGVGLAGPQIGESIRVLVAEYEEQAVALVNPEIIKRSEETLLGTEGCLSIPGVVGDDVPRHATVTVKARNPKGKEIRINAEGWFARILQHEIDHLDGVLFIDLIPRENVREVREDEVVEEAEVETVKKGKEGKDGKQGAVMQPEHNERLARPAAKTASAPHDGAAGRAAAVRPKAETTRRPAAAPQARNGVSSATGGAQ
jgi:peptide deformylase